MPHACRQTGSVSRRETRRTLVGWVLAVVVLGLAGEARADQVTGLGVTHRPGQLFFTWSSPPGTGWTYRLHASSAPIRAAEDLEGATLVGSVGDSTWYNARLSACTGAVHPYAIDSLGPPLDATQGLFVLTPASVRPRYYAVTAQRAPGAEDRTVTVGGNALAGRVAQLPERPRPVFQRTVPANTLAPLDVYTLWTSPVPTPDFPAMANRWGQAYDCGVVRGGDGNRHALAIRFCRRSGNYTLFPEGTGMPGEWSLSLDDFVPNHDQNTWWFGYHEGYDPRSSANPAPESGVVFDYTAQRVAFTVEWARSNFPVDTTRVYALGNSMGATGAVMFSLWRPDLVAATMAHLPRVDFSHEVDPDPACAFNPGHWERGVAERLWGPVSAGLPSNDGRPAYHRLNAGALVGDLEGSFVPPMIIFSGKHDWLIGWAEKMPFYQAMQAHRQGGMLFWDQRDHAGLATGHWTPMLDRTYLYRYRSDRSFPAFSNCTTDGEPGDGRAASGDSVGTVNAFIEWDTTIVDVPSRWEVRLTLRDLASLFGPVPAPDSLSVDVTPRRLRGFPMTPGSQHKFSVRRFSDGALVQSGQLAADAFGLVTVPAVVVYRAGGSFLTLEHVATPVGVGDGTTPVIRTAPAISGLGNPVRGEIALEVHWPAPGAGEIALFDPAGRRVRTLASGPVDRGGARLRFGVGGLRAGVYLIRVALDGAATTRRVALVR